MTLTETRPEHAEAADLAVEPAPWINRILGTGDHKTVGKLWIGFGGLYLVIAAVLGLVAAIEHVDLSGFDVVDDQDMFIQLWSMGRVLLVFGAIVPLLIGLATYLVPLQVGASAMAFPRGAAAAFWTWLLSAEILALAYILNGGPAGGRADFVVLWAVSLGALVGSLVWAMVCILTTILGARTTGMSMSRLPVSTWSFFVFCLGGLLALPVLMAELLLVYLDVRYGYLPTKDSRATLLAVIDSISLAPAAFWVGVPTLGIAVEAIGVHSGRPIRYHRTVLALLGVLGVLAFGADFLSFASRGRPVDFDNGLLVAAIAVVPLVVLAILAVAGDSLRSGDVRVRTPLAAGMSAGLLLLLAAAASILALIDPIVGFIEDAGDTTIDLDSAFSLNGTAFHEGIRALTIGAAVLGIVAGIHHWGHKMWGRALDDRIGLATTLLALVGAGLWGLGAIVTGFLGQERYPFVTADPDSGVEALNGVSVAGIALLVAAAALLFASLLMALLGRGSAVEPWTGYSLEWTTTSPPPEGNFAAAPVVTSATPALDAEPADSGSTDTKPADTGDGAGA